MNQHLNPPTLELKDMMAKNCHFEMSVAEPYPFKSKLKHVERRGSPHCISGLPGVWLKMLYNEASAHQDKQVFSLCVCVCHPQGQTVHALAGPFAE